MQTVILVFFLLAAIACLIYAWKTDDRNQELSSENSRLRRQVSECEIKLEQILEDIDTQGMDYPEDGSGIDFEAGWNSALDAIEYKVKLLTEPLPIVTMGK